MSTQKSYTEARAHLASLCDEVTSSREPVIITRRGKPDVALVAADELSALLETAHLMRSPRNAARLLKALTRARKREGASSTLEDLRRDLGLGEAQAD